MNPALNKLRIRIFLIFLLAVCLVVPVQTVLAQAAPAGLSFTLSVEPASLTAPGTVTVSARVSNAGAEDLNTPLSLYDPDGKLVTGFSDGGSLTRLPSGENYLWQGQYAVKQEQLDEGKLVYTLRYSAQDATGAVVEQNLPATAALTFTGEKVDLKVIRTISPEVVRRGKDVTVLYELVNQGNVKLTNLSLQENRLIATRAQTIASLEPGASAKITFTKKNVTSDLSSSALITYRKEGERQNRKITLDAIKVPLAKPALQFELTSDKTQVSIGETVTLTLKIKNAGNVSYSNITVTDPKLGEVFTNIQIAAGQSQEFTKEVTIKESSSFAFSLKLEDNTGTTQTEKVPELKVSAYAEGQMLRLNLTLTASSETISSLPGVIQFHLTVTNDSNTSAKDIKIRHAAVNIYTINELAPGQSQTITRDFNLSQPGKYQFTAVATDVQKNPVEFNSNPLTISYTAPTAAPTTKQVVTIAPAVTHSPLPQDFTPGGGQVKNIVFILTLILGAVLALSVVLLGASAVMRARARAKSNAAYDTFELAGTRDYTAPADQTRQAMEMQAEPGEQEAVPPLQSAQSEELPHEKYLRDLEDSAEDLQNIPQAADEEGTFRLTREGSDATAPDEDQEPADTEHRSRRARRHKADSDTSES